MKLPNFSLALVGCGFVAACSSSSPASPALKAVPDVTSYRIVSVDGSGLAAAAGDAKRLTLVRVMSDGSTSPLNVGTQVTWSGPPVVTALAAGSDAPSILPSSGRSATAFFLRNPDHYTDDELAGVLWVLDAGSDPNPTIAVKAAVASGNSPGEATANIVIGQMPVGDVTRGKTIYRDNCATCHGATGQGTAHFPGLNNAPDHVAGDPAWSATLFGMSARADMDNKGVSLDPAMPKWLTVPSSTGKLLSPSDFADVYGFLKTQTEPVTP